MCEADGHSGSLKTCRVVLLHLIVLRRPLGTAWDVPVLHRPLPSLVAFGQRSAVYFCVRGGVRAPLFWLAVTYEFARV